MSFGANCLPCCAISKRLGEINKFALKITSKLAKRTISVCAARAYTDASTTAPTTTFTKSSIALRTPLSLYSRYIINCLRKVSETTSAPILWISGHCLVARRPPPLVRAEEVSAWSKAPRYFTLTSTLSASSISLSDFSILRYVKLD